jgi:hypothetical protein
MRIASAVPHRRHSKSPRGRLQRTLTRTLPARRRQHPTRMARLAHRVTAMRRRATDRGAKPLDAVEQRHAHRRPLDVVTSAASRLTAGRR